MLQAMRDNAQGMIAKVIVFFIIVVFALWGVESIVSLGGGSSTPASVGDKDIQEADILRMMEQQKNNLRQQLGDQYNEDLFNEEFFRNSAIEQLIDQKVSLVQAEKLNVYASTEEIDRNIVSIPAFQLDGKFSKEQFQSVLRMNGWTPLGFRSLIAEEIKQNQAQSAFDLTTLVAPYNVQITEAVKAEKRTFRFLEIKKNDFKDKVKLTDDEINAYYSEQENQFKTDELARIKYVELDLNKLASEESASDEEVQLAYQDYIQAQQSQEQREASHILLEITDERDDKATQELANSLFDRLNKGEAFAGLAKEFSDDIATKKQSGSLGLNMRGAFAAEFEDALYALTEEGSVSAPVKTEFGYHIIRLDKVVSEEIKSLDEMKESLSHDIEREKAEAILAEQKQEMSNIAFSASSIDEVAEALNLPVQSTALFSRSSGGGIAANADIRNQVFEDNMLLDREVSPLVETKEGAVVFVVSEHKPASVKPLDEVKESIARTLTDEKAYELARQKAEKIESEQSDPKSWREVTTVHSSGSDAPRAAQQKAFSLTPKERALVSTDNGFSIVELISVDAKNWQDMQVSKELIDRERARERYMAQISYRHWAKAHTEIKRP